MGRKYSLVEIDELRRACENKINFGRYCYSNSKLTSWVSNSDSRNVEEMLRTLMMAGVTAREFIDQETSIYEEDMKIHNEFWSKQSEIDGGYYSYDGHRVTKKQYEELCGDWFVDKFDRLGNKVDCEKDKKQKKGIWGKIFG